MGTIRAVILHLSVFLIYKIYAQHPSIPDRNTRVEPFLSICLCDSKADPALAQESFEKRIIYTDACMTCFYACIITKLKLIYPNGTYNLDAFRQQYGGFAVMGDLIACNTTHGHNPDLCKRASGFLQCAEDALNRNPIAEKPSF